MTTTDGPDRPCRRTACAELGREPHRGGVHIDPRHEWYEGPHSTIQVLPLTVRQAARRLIDSAPALMPEVVDMAREILRLRDQVGHMMVEADHRELAALKRAESCEEHGKDIARLEEQVTHFEREADQNDAARRALLAGWWPLREAVEVLQERAKLGEAPDAATIVDTVARHVAKVMAAHGRAGRR